MNLSNEIQQFDKLEIDFDKLVNSTQDIYEGCVLIINLHDKNRLNEFVDDSLTKKVEMIITSTKCDIKSENIVKFKNFNEVYNHAVHKMLPNLNSINFFGITGTNGKTTTGYYLNQLLGKNSLFIGTTEQNLFKEITNEEHLTTPKLFNIFKLLRKEKYKEIKNVILEVSSHALDQNRLEGINFLISGFTNLSQDHFDYHKNIEDYFQAKQKLFHEEMSQQFVYIDDGWGKKLKDTTRNKSYSVGYSQDNDLHITSMYKNTKNNTFINFSLEGNDYSVELPFIGPNIDQNYLLAVGMAYFSNAIGIKDIIQNSSNIKNPKGRFENISYNGNDIFIDYAHTPEAIKRAVDVAKDSYDKVIVIMGAGGNRDSIKRSSMGKAANHADKVIITNDNPRKENPMEIAKEILKGINLNKDVEIILDRRLAIKKGIDLLEGDDALLVLGKGHENTQELKEGHVSFDDSIVVNEIIKEEK